MFKLRIKFEWRIFYTFDGYFSLQDCYSCFADDCKLMTVNFFMALSAL